MHGMAAMLGHHLITMVTASDGCPLQGKLRPAVHRPRIGKHMATVNTYIAIHHGCLYMAAAASVLIW